MPEFAPGDPGHVAEHNTVHAYRTGGLEAARAAGEVLEGNGFVLTTAVDDPPPAPAANQQRIYAVDLAGVPILRILRPDGRVFDMMLDTITVARNATGATIPAGSVVTPTGAVGQRLSIEPADSAVAATMPAIAMTVADIGNNADGFVQVLGRVTGVDTSAFAEGDRLFVGSNGGLVTAPPALPALRQLVGRVIVANASVGEVAFFPQQVGGDEDGTGSPTFQIGSATESALRLFSPDGTLHAVTVANDGTLSTAPVV